MRNGIEKKKNSNNKSKLIDGLKGRNLVFINESLAFNSFSNIGSNANSNDAAVEGMTEVKEANVNPKYCQIAKSLKNSNFSDNYFVMQLINNKKEGNSNNNRKENNVAAKAIEESGEINAEQNENGTQLNNCNIMNTTCGNNDDVNREELNGELEFLMSIKNLLEQIEKNQFHFDQTNFEISGQLNDSSENCKSDKSFDNKT